VRKRDREIGTKRCRNRTRDGEIEREKETHIDRKTCMHVNIKIEIERRYTERQRNKDTHRWRDTETLRGQ